VEDAIPEDYGVGLEIWDRAIPYYGATNILKPIDDIRELRTALARQHRFVVKDKHDDYDFFSCWEDDMIITSNHIQTYIDLSNEIMKLAKAAPGEKTNEEKNQATFASPKIIKNEYWSMIPGFMRVEVLQRPNDFKRVLHESIPVHESIESGDLTINSLSCCNVPKNQSSSLASWETSIDGIHLIHIPNSTMLDYVGLMPCKFWGRFKSYPKRDINQHQPNLFAQQAGWMLTKTQLDFINEECKGGILPPYNEPHWKDNALYFTRHNVEFWSGGYDLFFRCGIQRILSLDVEMFSNQLLWHSSNNKQIQREKDRFVRSNDLFGQMHTLKMRAMKEYGL